MQENFSTPILFLVFNRPDVTKKSFNVIRSIKPSKLYISSDGPRAGNENDLKSCGEVREIISNIDWNCEVQMKFNDNNLGCKLSVSSAIDWFFNNEEMGIIIEDDILPSISFFNYCEEMLIRFKDCEEVGVISGCNLLNNYESNSSYFFSNYPNIWGWATWKRVWKKYDLNMNNYLNWISGNNLNKLVPNIPFFAFYWKDQLDAVYYNKIDTWDFQFYYMMWSNSYLSVIPNNNLILNLGYNNNATHTNGFVPNFVKLMELQILNFPLNQNLIIRQDFKFDELVSISVYQISFFTTIKCKIKRMPFIGLLLSYIKQKIKKIFYV
jgi:hypothetical protein